MKSIALCVVAFFASFLAVESTAPLEPSSAAIGQTANLGCFSVSLAVKDISASKEFYEKLGFKVAGGMAEQNWLILRNGSVTVGLFQGMFEANIMTFNPGWDAQAEALKEFDDVRVLQKQFEESGLKLTTRADESSTGPANFTLLDPDGNMIYFDQHVPAPAMK